MNSVTKLVGVTMLSELIETVILTGRVHGVEPVSALLIAGPESGKTSIVCEKEAKSVAVFTDITGSGLMELCKYRPEISHFVLNDMTIITGHSKKTGQYFFSVLNAMIEEGLQATALPGRIDTFKAGKRALIGCTTLDLSQDKRRWWNSIGFSSRMLPICYQQSENLIVRIQNGIKHQALNPEKTKIINLSLNIPEAHIRVKMNEAQANEIHRLSKAKADQFKEIGHRRLKQYLALAMAHAIGRGKWAGCTVTNDDVRFLAGVQGFISYETPWLI